MPILFASVTGGIQMASFSLGILALLALFMLLVGGKGEQEAESNSHAAEKGTELQRGLARLLREGRVLQGRIQGAPLQYVPLVASTVRAWIERDVYQWLDNGRAIELAEEWKDTMPGVSSVSALEYRAAIGELSRESLVAQLRQGISLIEAWQKRMQ